MKAAGITTFSGSENTQIPQEQKDELQRMMGDCMTRFPWETGKLLGEYRMRYEAEAETNKRQRLRTAQNMRTAPRSANLIEDDDDLDTQPSEDEADDAMNGNADKDKAYAKVQRAWNRQMTRKMELLVAAVENCEALAALEVLILKSKDANNARFYKEAQELGEELMADTENGISNVYVHGLTIVLRCRSQKFKNRVLDKVKAGITVKALQARALSGAPTIKRALEGPVKSAFYHLKQAVQNKKGEVWPKSMARSAWMLRDGDEVIMTGKVLEDGIMHITGKTNFALRGVDFDARTIMDLIYNDEGKWKNFPYKCKYHDKASVSSPF